MLIACPTCHRQYDVGDLPEGARVRCNCGNLCKVPAPRVREAQMQHCALCGGAFSAGATQCEYCGSDIHLAERGLGNACPECFSRLVKDAGFCSTCGTRIAPEGIVRALAGRNCPRCEGKLVECELEQGRFIECSACGGIWLGEDAFEAFTKRHDEQSIAALVPSLGHGEPPRRAFETEVRYLPCPDCGQRMNRKNFASISGVVIDWCKGHGYWFDTHELEHIHRFIEDGGMDRARERRIRDQERRLSERKPRETAIVTGFGAPAWPKGPTHDRGNLSVDLLDLLVWLVTRVRGGD